ncbi:MAG: family 16 glycosylhydrolase [Beutenbergiaceae bacterium]
MAKATRPHARSKALARVFILVLIAAFTLVATPLVSPAQNGGNEVAERDPADPAAVWKPNESDALIAPERHLAEDPAGRMDRRTPGAEPSTTAPEDEDPQSPDAAEDPADPQAAESAEGSEEEPAAESAPDAEPAQAGQPSAAEPTQAPQLPTPVDPVRVPTTPVPAVDPVDAPPAQDPVPAAAPAPAADPEHGAAPAPAAAPMAGPVGPLPATPVIAFGSTWEYYRSAVGPAPAWKYDPASQGWASAPAPLGYGSDLVATQLPDSGTPLSTYVRHVFTIDDSNSGLLQAGAVLKTWADDGIIVYINGTEVGRPGVGSDWAGEHNATWATAAPPSIAAQADLVTVQVPGDVLREGANLVAVQVVSNYTVTRDISFDAELTAGGGGAPMSARQTTPNSSWNLVWSDEFDGTTLDPNNWYAYNDSAYGEGNLESACLMNRPENLSVSGGYLHLTARREAQPIQCGRDDYRYPGGREYTSAQIMSQGRQDFTYGRIEIRAQLPIAQGSSQGMWPAFWLLSSESMGEIDILEALGSGAGDDWQAGVIYHSMHESTRGDQRAVRSSYEVPRGADLSEGFHTYALEWESDEIRFFVDDVMTASYTSEEVPWMRDVFTDRAFYIRLNLAVGGDMPGYVTSDTVLPASYIIDYVRLYQP